MLPRLNENLEKGGGGGGGGAKGGEDLFILI